jgi:hypothetical protein
MEGQLIGFLNVRDIASAMRVSNGWMHTVKRVTQPITVTAVMPLLQGCSDCSNSNCSHAVRPSDGTTGPAWHTAFRSYHYYVPKSTLIHTMLELLAHDVPQQIGHAYVFKSVYWGGIDVNAPVSALTQHIIRGELERTWRNISSTRTRTGLAIHRTRYRPDR